MLLLQSSEISKPRPHFLFIPSRHPYGETLEFPFQAYENMSGCIQIAQESINVVTYHSHSLWNFISYCNMNLIVNNNNS